MNNHVARIFVLALCLILAGCDSTRFLYNRADWLLGRQANRYLDLDDSQKSYVKLELNHLFDWHRRTQLICYADLIDQFEHRARTTLTSEDITWLENEVMSHYGNLISSAIAPAAHTLGNLNKKQIAHLEKRLEKDRSRLARKLKPGLERRQQRRAKKTVSRIKKWFGRLSRTQVAWVSARSHELPDVYGPWLEYRAQRDGSLVELLRSGADVETITAVIEPLWTNAETSMAIDTEILMEKLKAQSITMAVEFYAATTTKQRAHFWSRLQDYRNDFRLLAKLEAGASCNLPIMRMTAE